MTEEELKILIKKLEIYKEIADLTLNEKAAVQRTIWVIKDNIIREKQ